MDAKHGHAEISASKLAEACEARALGIVAEYIRKTEDGTLIPFATMHNTDVLLSIALRLRGLPPIGGEHEDERA